VLTFLKKGLEFIMRFFGKEHSECLFNTASYLDMNNIMYPKTADEKLIGM